MEEEINTVDQLNAYGVELVAIEQRMKEMEAELHSLKSRAHFLKSEAMPDLMDQIGFSSFKIKPNQGMADQGMADEPVPEREFTITRGISGSFPKDVEKNARALEWLEQHEADGIVKTRLQADFPRSEYQAAKDIAHSISNRCDPTISATVHPMTLKKFARERLEAGQEIDLELLGLHSFRFVKVK